MIIISLICLGVGSRQIGPLADLAANWAPHFLVPWQIGPLENVGAQNWAPANQVPADWAPADWTHLGKVRVELSCSLHIYFYVVLKVRIFSQIWKKIAIM